LAAALKENEIKELIKTKRLEDYVKLGGVSRAEGFAGSLPHSRLVRLGFPYRWFICFTPGSSCLRKPVLVSDIPGNLEWIQNSQNGWTFPDGDVDQLSNQILQISVRNDLEKFGKSARRLAELRADWKVNSRSCYQHMTWQKRLPAGRNKKWAK